MSGPISLQRSLIVAMDVDGAEECGHLARAVEHVPGIGGFKFGIEAGIDGLKRAIDVTRPYTTMKQIFIYDHQKAGNDIPAMGPKFARAVKRAGCDAAILFPFAGPETQTVWTKSCQDANLRVIVGGVMTHPKFLVSEGGYIADDAPVRIFEQACEQDVQDFVVPGTKIEWVRRLRAHLDKILGEGAYVLYAPGFVSQGGDITECGQAAGPRFHAIVGSGIYNKPSASERREAAIQLTSKIAV